MINSYLYTKDFLKQTNMYSNQLKNQSIYYKKLTNNH
jgi:hypothetical protein